jgi:hypothetical protein
MCSHQMFIRYYILRDDMLGYYVNDISERLSVTHDHIEWEVQICLMLLRHTGNALIIVIVIRR